MHLCYIFGLSDIVTCHIKILVRFHNIFKFFTIFQNKIILGEIANKIIVLLPNPK